MQAEKNFPFIAQNSNWCACAVCAQLVLGRSFQMQAMQQCFWSWSYIRLIKFVFDFRFHCLLAWIKWQKIIKAVLFVWQFFEVKF